MWGTVMLYMSNAIFAKNKKSTTKKATQDESMARKIRIARWVARKD